MFSALLVFNLSAQTPQAFKYQTVVRNASNAILANTDVYFRISILQGSSSGTTVYQETFNLTTNDFGLAAFNIGQGSVVSGVFADISWSSYEFWVKVELDPDAAGTAAYEEVGTSQMLSVPYALDAKTAENAYWEKNANDISYSSGKVGIGTTSPTGYLEVTDNGVHNPYNLIVLGQTETSNRLRLSSGTNYAIISVGSTMDENMGLVIRHGTGNIGINETNPDSRLHVNGTAHITGNVSLDSKVTIPTAPVDNTDAANKAYVDQLLAQIEALNQRLLESKVGLVLWNKLGSTSEVENSEIGEDGILVGTAHAYETAKHGNGYVRKDVDSYIHFPKSVLQNLRSRGTLELWVNPKVTNPVPIIYGAFMIVGYRINDLDAHVFIRWGDGTTGLGINGGVNFAGSVISTPNEASQFIASIGTPFHLAVVWDVDGIDGTTETVRMYRDGVVIGSSTTTWNDQATTDYDDFKLGTGPDEEGFDRFITDNIKVWNYAKTDFSDRFKE